MRPPVWLRRLPLPLPLKHLAGSAWAMKGPLFAAGAIAAFGLSVFVGALSAVDSIFASRDQWYDRGHLADLELRVVADDVLNFPRFDDLPGVAGVGTRMVYPGSLTTPDGHTVGGLLITPHEDAAVPINTREMVGGTDLDPADPDGVVVEESLARYHGVVPGDRLSVTLGKEVIDVRVRGVTQSAEFLLAPANPSLFVPGKGSLGVLYANPSLLSGRFGFRLANSVLLRAAPGADLEALRAAVIERAATRLTVDWTATRGEQFSYRFLAKNLGVFQILIPVIVLVSALSALVVTVFLLARWIAGERQHLGLLLALGHPPRSLALGYGAMVAWIAGGAVLGGLVMAVPLGRGFLENFSGSIGLPLPPLVLTPRLVVSGSLGLAAVLGLAGALASLHLFTLSPRDAMRRPPLAQQGPDRLGGALGRLLPVAWLRIPLRNLVRNRLVSGMTVLSVALGIGITASFSIAFSSFMGSSVTGIDENAWDLAVDFVAPVWDEDLPGILAPARPRDSAPYTKGVAQAVTQGQRVNLYIGGFDPAKPWHRVDLVAGTDLDPARGDGILLEQSTARTLGLAVGDALRLEQPGRSVEARIVGLFSGAMPGEARLPIALHRELADLAERSTGVFVQTDGDPAATAAALRAHADVRQVLDKGQVKAEILAASGQVTGIVRLGAMVSIAIAALFTFACVAYTVLGRRGDYQTLRLLGYADSLILTIVVAEVALLSVAALVLAVPVATLSALHLNARISEAWFQVDTLISARDYLTSFVPTLIVLPLVALPIARLVLRQPLESHLRSREIA